MAQGDTIHQIAKLFDRGHSSIQRILSETGGIHPLQRHRTPRALTLAEREEISRFLVSGLSIRAIAAQLRRAPSTKVASYSATEQPDSIVLVARNRANLKETADAVQKAGAKTIAIDIDLARAPAPVPSELVASDPPIQW